MKTLFYLIAGHYLADFPLQGEYLSNSKGSNFHAMAAHCMIQALTVMLATGDLRLAMIEFFAHAIIDKMKCNGWLSLNQDQCLHLTLRVAYSVLLFRR